MYPENFEIFPGNIYIMTSSAIKGVNMNPADEQMKMSETISSTDNLREELDRVERKLNAMYDYVENNPN